MSIQRKIKHVSIRLGVYCYLRSFKRLLNASERKRFHRMRCFFQHLLQQPANCFDIGANDGVVSEVLAGLGHRIVAYEPHPVCFRELAARCGRFVGFASENKAVGERLGEMSLFINSDSSEQSSLVPNWLGKKSSSVIEVEVTTYDAEVQNHFTPDFCKIDVEGFELPVLKGMTMPPAMLSIEFHTDEAGLVELGKCLAKIQSFGPFEGNITWGASWEFQFGKWVNCEEISRTIRNSEAGMYGDLYVRFTNRSFLED